VKVTTDHATSSYGVPVIIDDRGLVLDYAPGVKAVRSRLGISTTQLGEACGVSRRTVEGWEQGRMPTVAALNVMCDLLRKLPRSRRGPGRRPVRSS
jgi:DNA-binding XRE family transcriptional regulator